MKIRFSIALLCIVSVIACKGGAIGETPIKTTKAGDMTVTLASRGGELKSGETELFIAFTDAAGNPVDVGAASLVFHMAGMGTMPEMNDKAQLTTTETPGRYRAQANIQMSGTWEAQVAYQGSQGTGQATMTVSVK